MSASPRRCGSDYLGLFPFNFEQSKSLALIRQTSPWWYEIRILIIGTTDITEATVSTAIRCEGASRVEEFSACANQKAFG
jgi:hypothetical protein